MRNLKINLGEFIGRRGVALVLAGTMLAGLTGCGKKAECEVEGDHAHLYTSEEGYSAWYDKEYLVYDGYNRQDEYVPLTKEEKELNKFLDKKDLIRLDENLDTILSDTENNHDYVEYRYRYKKWVTRMMGKIPRRVRVTRYAWTTDPNHAGLTGESRVCHYVYQGCNVYKDEYGKYVVVPSDEVDDIGELVGSYEYVRKTYSKVVNLEDKKEVDYEDGPDENELYDDVAEQSYTTSSEHESGPKLVKTNK